MGFSVTAAYVIFTLAFLSAGSVALNAYWRTQGEMQDASRAQAQRAADYAHTNLTITSIDCAPVSCDAITSITIHAHNGGDTILNATAWTYVLDGVVSTATPAITITDPVVSVTPGTELLLPGEDAAVTLAIAGAPDSLSVKLVTENGAGAEGKVA
jgi:archaellum component FlaF (FlaF/FlaG flagellin family)